MTNTYVTLPRGMRSIKAGEFDGGIKLFETTARRGLKAMREASRIAEEYGIADMTLDEINAEISEARKSR